MFYQTSFLLISITLIFHKRDCLKYYSLPFPVSLPSLPWCYNPSGNIYYQFSCIVLVLIICKNHSK